MHVVTRDGIALAYEEAGRGQPPMLFVHGWCCDHTYFGPQVEHFAPSHRTISVDLRGHGQSDAPNQAYTIEGFADDLVWLSAQLRVQRPIVIGHSMGGVIALQLAAQFPEMASAIVMVDAPVMQLTDPPPPTDARSGFIQALWGPDYRAAARRFIDRMFLPTDEPTRRARIIEQMTSTHQHVMASAFEQVDACDLASAAAACKAPALYIQAALPRPGLDRLPELCPHIVIGQTVGAGHFNQLEAPDQVNAMIERFLATSLASA